MRMFSVWEKEVLSVLVEVVGVPDSGAAAPKNGESRSTKLPQLDYW